MTSNFKYSIMNYINKERELIEMKNLKVQYEKNNKNKGDGKYGKNIFNER